MKNYYVKLAGASAIIFGIFGFIFSLNYLGFDVPVILSMSGENSPGEVQNFDSTVKDNSTGIDSKGTDPEGEQIEEYEKFISPTPTVAWVPGKLGNAIFFGPADEWFDCGNTDTTKLFGATDMTISA